MNKEMSLDVALDIIGTLRMMKIDEISEEKDENRKKILQKELSVLNTEEKIAWHLPCRYRGKIPPHGKMQHQGILHPH